MANKQPLPTVGEYYHFFDDGKTRPSRHHICRVERIIPIDEAKNTIVSGVTDYNESLWDCWIEEKKECDFLYAEDTDYIIEISCPTYDENMLYAARTKDGGWFTMNVQWWWQSGRLDVDGSIYKEVTDYWREGGYYATLEQYNEANEENYLKK